MLSSSSVGSFYKKNLDQPMPVGRNINGTLERVPFGGAVRFLPGVPLRTVNEREGFISARVDYLNHLFTNSPYLVGEASNLSLANLDVLIPRVVFTVTASGKGTAAQFQDSVLKTIDIKPLDVHDLDTEVARLGGDMYIYLARQNVQIYLLGGILLALIGIFAVAYANYVEDRRTLALLRIRGAGPTGGCALLHAQHSWTIGGRVRHRRLGRACRRLRHHQARLGPAAAADRVELPAHPSRGIAANRPHCRHIAADGDGDRNCVRPMGVCTHGTAKPA